RVKVDEDEVLLKWLRRLQEQQIETRQYEFSPLSRIQKWSEIDRGKPLFESLLVFENYQTSSGHMVETERGDIVGFRAQDWTNYPLVLSVGPSANLLLRISYDKNRFGHEAIERMLRHLERLLEEMVSKQDQPLKALSIHSEAELHQILSGWNDTQIEFRSGQQVHQLFEAQVLRNPETVALNSAAERLSY